MSVNDYILKIENAYKSSELTYETMLEFFFNIEGLPIYYIPMRSGSYMIRARYKSAKEEFEKPSEFSYPPSSNVQSFSRLNRPKQSLFYASETEHACLTEMMRFWGEEFELGDKIKVAMGKWRLTEDIRLIIIPDPKNESELNQNIVKKLNSEELKFWSYISNKFKTTGLEEKNIYELTSAFSNSIYINTKRKDKSVCGFIFCSVQSPNELNLALDKELIDSKKVILEQLAEMQCTKIGIDKRKLPYYTEILGSRKKGLIENEIINWK